MRERRAVGEVAIEVAVPDGAPTPERAIVWFQPKTPEEFEQMAALVGGVEELKMPDGRYYGSPATTEGDDFFRVAIYPPPESSVGEAAPTEDPPHRFFGRYASGGNV